MYCLCNVELENTIITKLWYEKLHERAQNIHHWRARRTAPPTVQNTELGSVVISVLCRLDIPYTNCDAIICISYSNYTYGCALEANRTT